MSYQVSFICIVKFTRISTLNSRQVSFICVVSSTMLSILDPLATKPHLTILEHGEPACSHSDDVYGGIYKTLHTIHPIL